MQSASWLILVFFSCSLLWDKYTNVYPSNLCNSSVIPWYDASLSLRVEMSCSIKGWDTKIPASIDIWNHLVVTNSTLVISWLVLLTSSSNSNNGILDSVFDEDGNYCRCNPGSHCLCRSSSRQQGSCQHILGRRCLNYKTSRLNVKSSCNWLLNKVKFNKNPNESNEIIRWMQMLLKYQKLNLHQSDRILRNKPERNWNPEPTLP